jgi:hypothetical protein
MKYQYFTEKLVNQDVLDLTQVFPDKMAQIRTTKNIDYGLLEIVMFLKQKSNNFSVADQLMIDLDYGIREVIERYYKSIGKDNPFITDGEDEELKKYRQGQVRRDSVTVIPGKTTKKKEKEKPQEPAKKKAKTKEDIESEIDGLKFLLDDPDIADDVQAAIDALEILLP